jgi:hypothetical protein
LNTIWDWLKLWTIWKDWMKSNKKTNKRMNNPRKKRNDV